MLIAIEGIDGAGKSTQVSLLVEWLKDMGREFGQGPFLSKWNSSPVVEGAVKKAKKLRLLTPRTFALLEAADLADRYDRVIAPELVLGNFVVADRWVYTAFARGIARGLDEAWLRGIYSFAPLPDICFYLKVPVETALQRILKERAPKYYEAGMDVDVNSGDPNECFLRFQQAGVLTYEQFAGFVAIDATLPVEEIHLIIKHMVMDSMRCPNR